jgi:Winged helix DNA-binding domain
VSESGADGRALLRRRLTAQLLTGPPVGDPVDVARRLLAIQAQDPRGARLAIRARSRGVAGADVDRELTERRSLLITWLNRGTLHLVTSEDYPWLQALTTPPLITSSTRRLAEEGIGAAMTDRSLAVIERSLAADGPLTRAALRERLLSAGVPVEGQALVQVLFRAAVAGLVVRGPMAQGEHAYVLVRDWLPAAGRPVDRDVALAELARRYLLGHGPADERDLARWAGLPLRDTRAGLQAIADELLTEPGGLIDLARRPGARRAGRLPPPRLLGAFEPLLVGWTSRAHVLGEHDATVVTGGMFRNFALVKGRPVATWRFQGAEVELERFADVSDDDARALDDDARALLRFLGRA